MEEEQKENLSKCCNAPIKVAVREIGHDIIEQQICTKCGKKSYIGTGDVAKG